MKIGSDLEKEKCFLKIKHSINSSSKFNNMLLDIMTFLNQLDDEQKGILYPIFEEIAKIIIKSKE